MSLEMQLSNRSHNKEIFLEKGANNFCASSNFKKEILHFLINVWVSLNF